MNASFSETQKFRQRWWWIILLILLSTALCLRNGIVHDCLTYDSLMPELGLVVFSAVIVIAIFLLLIFMKLQTRVDETGIYYKYVPLHREEIKIDWKNIKEAYVRRYNPMLEYGGWGIKMGIFGKGRAYNVSGNMGLQIVFTNGKHLLLGTCKPEELKEVLNKLAGLGIVNRNSNNTDRF